MASTTYDDVAYPGYPYPQTHPNALATLGHLFGLDTVPVEHCRVLELGCGDGQNLLPMALALPDSRFVGIDLAESAIRDGQRWASDLGIGNIQLLHEDVLAFDCAPGSFDYIIAHGLYSWVPPAVQQKILQIIQTGLSQSGIAYVSYNTLPGGHFRLMAREMMQYHTATLDHPRAKAERGKELMSFLAQAAPKSKAYGALLAEMWGQDLSKKVDEVLLHDELGPFNENLYFHEFISRAERHSLQFLAEAIFMEMYPPDLEPQVASFLDQFESDVLAREQYLDFIKGRRFRQTLLCRADRAVQRDISLEKVAQLRFAGNPKPRQPLFEPQATSPVEFEGASGAVMTLGHPLVKAALVILLESWPQSFSLDELHLQAVRKLEQAEIPPQRFDHPEDHIHLLKTLFVAFRAGLLQVGVSRRNLVRHPSEHPCASPLARLQAERNCSHATTLLHTRWQISGPFERELLLLLDGTHDRPSLAEAMAERMRSDSASLKSAESPFHDEQALRAAVQERLAASLDMFSRAGLMLA
jgi:methyltransferase-like protein/predicted O-methyltransferase YrrM